MKTSLKYFYVFLICIHFSCENFFLGPDLENTPENNFEILWKEFDQYYPSFIVKNINWDSLYSVYRNEVTPTTTEDELWSIFKQMLIHFNDRHVYVYRQNPLELFIASPSRDLGYGEFELNLVRSRYLNYQYGILGDGRFTYGRISTDRSIGYLHIRNFSEAGDWVEDIHTVIRDLSDTESMIIDLRYNLGGLLSNYKYVASAFLNDPVTYKQIMSRNGPEHHNLTEPYFVTIYPNQLSHTYSKKIVVLTDRQTVSASELFILALKQLPYCTQIGDSTAGALGGSYRRFQLLNGWSYHMPTALVLTIDGECLESGIGVAPDIYVRNSVEEIKNYYDRILEYTIDHLKR